MFPEDAYILGQNAGWANKPCYPTPYDIVTQEDEYFAFLAGYEDIQTERAKA